MKMGSSRRAIVGFLVSSTLFSISASRVAAQQEKPFVTKPTATSSAKPSANKTPAVKPPAKPAPKVVAPPKMTRDQLETGIAGDQIRLIEFASDRLRHLRGDEINCLDCFASSAGTGNSSLDKKSSAELCKGKWGDFYSKDVVDVSFVFGYEDFYDDAVSGDSIRRETMRRKVLEPCKANPLVQACGFSETDDLDVLEKTVIGPTGKEHTLRLRLTASSYSSSDRINRLYPEEQKAASERASKAFYGGLKTADMLLYIGHARDGGGPDFDPAVKRADGSIDYDYYTTKRPGLEKLTKEMMNAKKSPKILGFLACDSERWSASLTRMAPKSGLILSATKTIALEAAVVQAFLALDSVIWQRCSEGFNKAISQINQYDGKPVLPLKLERFY